MGVHGLLGVFHRWHDAGNGAGAASGASGEFAHAVVDVTPMNDTIVDTCLQVLPVVCIGGDASFELETHVLAAAIGGGQHDTSFTPAGAESPTRLLYRLCRAQMPRRPLPSVSAHRVSPGTSRRDDPRF